MAYNVSRAGPVRTFSSGVSLETDCNLSNSLQFENQFEHWASAVLAVVFFF